MWITSVSVYLHTQYYKGRFMTTQELVKDCFRKHKSGKIQAIAFPKGALKEFTFELAPKTLSLNLSHIIQEIL